MFERGRKNDDIIESPDAIPGEADKAFGSFRSRATDRSKDVAVTGSSIQIKGDLRGDEDLRIEGNVSGTVQLTNSALTIGKGGKVKAGVYAKSIVVDGETTGDLHATECVSIHANARVQGNIIAPRVSIVEGAHFKGSIEMDPEAVEQALGKTTARKPGKPAEPKQKSSAADAKSTSNSSTSNSNTSNKSSANDTAKDASAAASPQARSA